MGSTDARDVPGASDEDPEPPGVAAARVVPVPVEDVAAEFVPVEPVAAVVSVPLPAVVLLALESVIADDVL